MGPIKLLDNEKVYNHVIFNTPLDPTWSEKNQEVFDYQTLLMKSLLNRNAIPEQRLRYFVDPEYNTSRTKLSKKEVFESNGTRGDDIYSHPHFKPYLNYFINGSDMATNVKEQAERLWSNRNINDDVSDKLYAYLNANKDLYKIVSPRDWFAEEFFKLLIDYDVNPVIAKHYRSMIMKWGY